MLKTMCYLSTNKVVILSPALDWRTVTRRLTAQMHLPLSVQPKAMESRNKKQVAFHIFSIIDSPIPH